MGSSTVMYDDASSPVTFKGEDAKNLVNGVSAKAWVNFNGTGTLAVRDSFNVSSVTDNGSGNYIINFATPMPNANYLFVGMGGATSTVARGGGNVTSQVVEGGAGNAPSTTALPVFLNAGSSSTLDAVVSDSYHINVAIFSN